jgi:hypothetical protein
MDEGPVFVDDVTQAAYQAMLTRDWDGLRLLFHPCCAVDDIRRRGNELESVCRLSRLGATRGTVK